MFDHNPINRWLGQTVLRKVLVLTFPCSVFSLGSFSAGWAATPMAGPDGAKVYEQRCASCHNGKVSRAPQMPALRQRTPEAILDALETGVMKFTGLGMPDAERKAVSEFVAGKPLGGEAQLKETATNFCPQAPGEFAPPDNGPRWNGWGASLANARFQPAEQAGLRAEQVPNLKLKWAFGFPPSTVASQP